MNLTPQHNLRTLTWAIAAATFWSATASGVDKVIVRRESSAADQQLSGTIVAYDRQRVLLDTGGHERKIPVAMVVRCDFQRTEGHQAGDKALADGAWTAALREYANAQKDENRLWVREMILSQAAVAYRELGDVPRAVDIMLALARENPTTRHLDALPLVWTTSPSAAGLERQAQQWMADDDSPIGRLIGASWLLSGQQRAAAIKELESLANATDVWIAHLASAQLWRTRIATANVGERQRWEAQIQRMPTSLRGGPYFVLAGTLARHGEREQATLSYLRVPVLYPDQRRLAIAALMSAAELLKEMQRSNEAAELYQEVVTLDADGRQAQLAQQRLAGLTQSEE